MRPTLSSVNPVYHACMVTNQQPLKAQNTRENEANDKHLDQINSSKQQQDRRNSATRQQPLVSLPTNSKGLRRRNGKNTSK